ncbi:ATP-dependent Clp protease ATP-binding subunit, partial [Enterococcus lactis]
WLKTLYRKRAVTWPFIFYTIIWTLSSDRFEKIISYLKKCLSNFLEKKYKTAKVI